MIKIFTTLMFWFDFTVGYMMTSERNRPYYHKMMWDKYGTRYCSKERFDEYWHSLDDDETSSFYHKEP